MEYHPIPQDVISFQFKLIGDMTVKQFAYLAAGVIAAWIFFSIPIPFLIKFPLALLSGTTGVVFAFIPIEGRPADTIIIYFLKAIFEPNQYYYQKVGKQILPAFTVNKQMQTTKQIQNKQDTNKKLEKFLEKLPKKPKSKLDEKETVYLKSLTSIFKGENIPAFNDTTGSIPTNVISMEEENQMRFENSQIQDEENLEDSQKRTKEALEKEALLIQKELETTKAQELTQKEPEVASDIHQKVSELEKQLNETLTQKQELEKMLVTLQRKLGEQKQDIYSPSANRPKMESQNVRKIPVSMGKSVGLPIAPDVPNLITGIIKDPRGNVLTNILVEVKDKEGNPVRAFKTNGLGQFLSATPVLNGVYTIQFDDPEGKNKFDTIEISANGEIISPLEVISHDEREELRKALFNN